MKNILIIILSIIIFIMAIQMKNDKNCGVDINEAINSGGLTLD